MNDDMHVSGAPGAAYLVRTQDSDGTARQLFTDDEKHGVLAAEALIAYLTSLIQLNRYAIGPAIRSIRRWDGDDSLHEMHLSIAAIRQEMEDFDDEEWLLEDPLRHDADITFTVRIDRKGQQ